MHQSDDVHHGITIGSFLHRFSADIRVDVFRRVESVKPIDVARIGVVHQRTPAGKVQYRVNRIGRE
jgi:hypothetical protein